MIAGVAAGPGAGVGYPDARGSITDFRLARPLE